MLKCVSRLEYALVELAAAGHKVGSQVKHFTMPPTTIIQGAIERYKEVFNRAIETPIPDDIRKHVATKLKAYKHMIAEGMTHRNAMISVYGDDKSRENLARMAFLDWVKEQLKS
jgi:hypothetical protein